MTAPWIVRDALPSDEGLVLELWYKAWAYHGLGRRASSADRDATWTTTRYNALRAFKRGLVRVACDPDDAWMVIGFVCMQDDTVHFAAVKHQFDEERADIIRDLLGDALDERRFYTYVIPAISPMPAQWVYDPQRLPYMLRDNEL